MARLLAFGDDNGRKALSDLDAVDLEAVQAVSASGISTGGHVEIVPPEPCSRPDCGGSVLIWTASDGVSCAPAPAP